MKLNEVEDLIIKHEGFRKIPYLCSAGRLTIGYGRNISDKGITKEEADFLLKEDIMKCVIDLDAFIFPGLFKDWDNRLQHAMIDMRFQLGIRGFRNFKKMISALRKNDRKLAATEAVDSIWFKQVPNRAKTIVKMIRG